VKQKILFICHRIPYPPNKGEKIRSYNILRYLCRRHEVSLAFLIDDRQDEVHADSLRAMVKTLCYDIIRPRAKKLRSSLSLLCGRPLSVPYFYSPALQKEIDGLLDRQEVDCIFCSSSPTAEYVFRSRHFAGKCQHARRMMDFIDMDSYKWQQYAQTARRPMRWIYQHEAKYLMAYESRIANFFQRIFFVTEAEKDLFLRHIPCDNAQAIGNGVDLSFFNPSHASPLKKNGPALVFTGAMDYPPNIEGISWFSEEIFPVVRKTIPDLLLYIVGSRPSEKVLRLDRQEGVTVTGYVKDIRDYLAMADICIAPLRIARGIQNKVLEAMAMGKATVCTPEALEGIPARPGEHLVVADGEERFAVQLIKLLTDRAAAALLGNQARRFIEKEFSWDAQLSPLDSLLS